MTYLTDTPLDPAALEQAVHGPDRGAVVVFTGTVRDHHVGKEVTGLSYSAYGTMAEGECAGIVAEAEGRWPVTIALGHRVGDLAVGDIAVVVAVAGEHRAVAFEACRFVIEEVKRRVPIWKRERYQDGSEAWVDPTAPTGTQPASRMTGPA